MTELTKATFEAEVEKLGGVAVIDLYADWCGPCKMMAPVMEELDGELSSARFYMVNVDNEPELAVAFKVESIPMIAVVKDGVFVDFSIGFKPKEEIKRFIKNYL